MLSGEHFFQTWSKRTSFKYGLSTLHQTWSKCNQAIASIRRMIMSTVYKVLSDDRYCQLWTWGCNTNISFKHSLSPISWTRLSARSRCKHISKRIIWQSWPSAIKQILYHPWYLRYQTNISLICGECSINQTYLPVMIAVSS